MENEQSLKQKKIMFAQSEHAEIIVEILKDCMPNNPIVTDTEWGTLVNAITLDVHSTMMLRVVEYLNEIRQGKLHEQI